ncbi:MAG TPA: hypothetical protein PLV68_04215, partial [Ilumatobacteraceae bacterium]|nr:hypothetical protein [Ilumatobacteraceae bacterium]
MIPESAIMIDNLPAGVEFVSATDGGVYDLSAHRVTWSPAPKFSSSSNGEASVTVRFPADVFSAGAIIVNNATVSGVPYGKTESDRITAPASASHSLSDPVYGRQMFKQVYSSIGRSQTGQFNAPATRGDVAGWNPGVWNRSNVPVDLHVYDTIQPDVGVTSIRYTGHRLILTYTDATEQTFTKLDPTSQQLVTVPVGKTVASIELVREATPPNEQVQMWIDGPVGLGGAATVRNCADSIGRLDGVEVWNTIGVANQQACAGLVIIDTMPIPNVTVSGGPQRLPGQEASWNLYPRNASITTADPVLRELTTITQPRAVIVLGPGHTYVVGSMTCESAPDPVDRCVVTVSSDGVNQQVTAVWPDRKLLPVDSVAERRIVTAF